MSLNNVKIEEDSIKRSPFNFGHDTFTTLEHGVCQPIHVKHVLGGSKNTLSCTQMTRLAPLIHPTFGRITLSQYWQFVSCRSLLKQFPHFLGQVERYQSYAAGAQIVSKLPTITAQMLLYYLSTKGWSQYYTRAQTDGSPDVTKEWNLFTPTSTSKDATISSWNFLSTGSNGVNFHPLSEILSIHSVTHSSYFTPDKADYSWYAPASTSSNDHLTTLKLTTYGCRLNSAFIACGMIPSMDNTIKYNCLPLFALYKAYFDIMRRPLVQYYNWETCSLYKLLRWYDVNGCGFEMSLQNDSQSWMAELHDLWEDFIHDLSEMYYSSNVDFLSAHLPLDFMSSSSTLARMDAIENLTSYTANESSKTFGSRQDSYGHNMDGLNPLSGLPMTGNTASSVRAWFNQLSDEWCRMAYYYINKRSQIGYNLAAELRLRGFSDFVDDVDSAYIGNSRTLLPISEVISTSDTETRSLGDYAGQSSKYSDLPTYHYNAKEQGYIIGMVCVNPEIRQCNQASEDALSSTSSEWYSNVTDGFGYSATPRISIGYYDACESLQNNTTTRVSTTDSSTAFGLVPRHFGKKLCSNLKLGAAALNSQRENWESFYLDRPLTAHVRGAEVRSYSSSDGKFKNNMGDTLTPLLNGYGLPDADSSWRFYAQSSMTNQYNRIFEYGQIEQIPYLDSTQYNGYPVHNYMSIFVINHNCVQSMLPCSMSWETIECEDDPNRLATTTK